jgi:TPR repeat protein
LIANHYEHGRGVQKSHKTARLWYKRAAERGYAMSQCSLANMLYNGEGGPVSMDQARVW